MLALRNVGVDLFVKAGRRSAGTKEKKAKGKRKKETVAAQFESPSLKWGYFA